MKMYWVVVTFILTNVGCNVLLGINGAENRLHNGDACALSSDCISGHCVNNVCSESACAVDCSAACSECGPAGTCVPVPAGSGCVGGTCNDTGECVYDNGGKCQSGTECSSGFCVNGICCDQACSGECVTCGNGICTNVKAGEPDSISCMGAFSCDGNGVCKKTDAQSCIDEDQCVSGICANKLCSARSCIDLAKACGPSSNENCCASPQIAGGTYNRSNDANYPAELQDFRLDRFEVTVGRFRKFIADYPKSIPKAGAGAHLAIPGSGWDPEWNSRLPATTGSLTAQLRTCGASSNPPWVPDQLIQWPRLDQPLRPSPPGPTTSSSSSSGTSMIHFLEPPGGDSPGPFDPSVIDRRPSWSDESSGLETENLPLNCVTWYEAFAFCAWDGGRLVTEAEWNYSAAGGSEQREYPWGIATPDLTYTDLLTCSPKWSNECKTPSVSPVGSRSPISDSKWHHADLAGSMNEWTLDEYHEPYMTPCDNCAELAGNGPRVVRTGLPNSSRSSASPDKRSAYIGFRCAR